MSFTFIQLKMWKREMKKCFSGKKYKFDIETLI